MKRPSTAVRQVEQKAEEVWKQVKVGVEEFKTQAAELFKEGKIRSVVVENSTGEEVARIPVFAAVPAALFAPLVTYVLALVSLGTGHSIKLEKRTPQQ